MRFQISLLAIVGIGLASTASADEINFEKDIWPFVKVSCVDCHLPPHKDERGRTRKPKAGLVITNKADFLEGGNGGKTIIPGDPDNSSFLQLTLLDPGHDDFMPPEGKAEPWTEEQKKLFAAWIKADADFGDWERDPEVDIKDE